MAAATPRPRVRPVRPNAHQTPSGGAFTAQCRPSLSENKTAGLEVPLEHLLLKGVITFDVALQAARVINYGIRGLLVSRALGLLPDDEFTPQAQLLARRVLELLLPTAPAARHRRRRPPPPRHAESLNHTWERTQQRSLAPRSGPFPSPTLLSLGNASHRSHVEPATETLEPVNLHNRDAHSPVDENDLHDAAAASYRARP